MAIVDLAIDFGSSNTTIFQYGTGIVLREPTVIALKKGKTQEVIATGAKAKRMYGKVALGLQVISPVRDGVIISNEAAVALLKEFISRIIPESLIKPRLRALIATPCGLSLAERKTYENVFQKAGISEVTILDTPVALARIIPSNGIFVDIGGGVTDVAMVVNNAIIDGVSVNIAGEAFNNAITDYLFDKQNVKIGQSTIEKIKLAVLSLHENDASSIDVIGRDADTGASRNFTMYAVEAGSTIEPLVKKIAKIVSSMLAYAPPEVSEEMTENGIYLCGGSAVIPGLCELLANLTNIKVTLLDDPALTLISSLGLLCGERDKVAKLLNLKQI